MKIGQISPIRSGSTLVYNILKELFPNIQIDKDHNFLNSNNYTHVIATIRHPFDSIISSVKCFGKEINDENILKFTDDYLNNGGNEMEMMDDLIILKYEEFYKDYNIIYDKLELCFNIQIPKEQRNYINNKYNINKVIEITKQYKDFYEYDKNTHFHGNHISTTLGESIYKSILTNKQKNGIMSNVKILNIMKKYNYMCE